MKRTVFRCNYPLHNDESAEGQLCLHIISKLEDAREDLATTESGSNMMTPKIYKYSVELTNVSLRYLHESKMCYSTYPDLSSGSSNLAAKCASAWFILPSTPQADSKIPKKWLKLQRNDIKRRIEAAPGAHPPSERFVRTLQEAVAKLYNAKAKPPNAVFNFVSWLNKIFQKILSLFNHSVAVSPNSVAWPSRIDLLDILPISSHRLRTRLTNLCKCVDRIYCSLVRLYYNINCGEQLLPLGQSKYKVHHKRLQRQSDSSGKRFAKGNNGKRTMAYASSSTSNSSDTDAFPFPAPCSSPSFQDMVCSSSSMAPNLTDASDSAQDFINIGSMIDLTSPKNLDAKASEDDMSVTTEPVPKEPIPVWTKDSKYSSWCADCAKAAGTHEKTLQANNGSFSWIPCKQHKPHESPNLFETLMMDSDDDYATPVSVSASSPSASTSVSVSASSSSTSTSVFVSASSSSTSTSVSVSASSLPTSISVPAASVSSSSNEVELLRRELAATKRTLQEFKQEQSKADIQRYKDTFKPDFTFIPRVNPLPASVLYRAAGGMCGDLENRDKNHAHFPKCRDLLAYIQDGETMKSNGYLLHNSVLFICRICNKICCPYHCICKHGKKNAKRPRSQQIPRTFVHYPNSLWRLKSDYLDTISKGKIDTGILESYSGRKAGLCRLFSRKAIEKWTGDRNPSNIVKYTVAVRAYYSIIEWTNLDYLYMAGPDNGVSWGRSDTEGYRTCGMPSFSFDYPDWICPQRLQSPVRLKQLLSGDKSIKWFRNSLRDDPYPAHDYLVEGAIYHLNADRYKCPRRSLVCLTLYMIGIHLLLPSAQKCLDQNFWMEVFSYLSAPWTEQTTYVVFYESFQLWQKRVKNMSYFAELEAERLRANWTYEPSVWPWEVGVTQRILQRRILDAQSGRHPPQDRDPLIQWHISTKHCNRAYEAYIDSIPNYNPFNHVYGLSTRYMMGARR